MTEIRVSGSATISNIEDILLKLEGVKDQTIYLSLPRNLRHARFGGLSSLLQAIASCTKRNKLQLILYDDGSSNPESIIRSVITLPHCLIGIIFSDSVFIKNSTIDVTAIAKRAAFAQAESICHIDYTGGSVQITKEIRQIMRGGSSIFIAVDNISEYCQLFYDGKLLRPEDQMSTLLEETIDASISVTKRMYGMHYKTAISEISSILFELFSNTHDHARKKIDGQELSKSIRGLSISSHLQLTRSLEIKDEYVPINNYIERILLQNKNRSSINFIELSIFDNGPGIARRQKGLEILDSDEEFRVVNNCFMGKSNIGNDPHKGYGLQRVALLAKKIDAFIRYRSGSLDLFYDRELQKRQSQIHNPLQLHKNGLGCADGALFSILFALNNQGIE
jgi:hypothetical protein